MAILSGWKQIGSYLRRGVGVRTVQRWELIGLPIHRPRVGAGSVIEELDTWSHAAPIKYLDQIAHLRSEVEGLKAELKHLKAQQQAERSKKTRIAAHYDSGGN
jgi:hypothetical protein